MWLLVFAVCSLSVCANCDNRPEQIHLSLGDGANSIVITWTTLNPANSTIVLFGTTEPDTIMSGKQAIFIDGGSQQRKIYIHSVILENLLSDTEYVYRAGSDALASINDNKFWSPIYKFRTFPAGSEWPLRAAMLGDLGLENGRSIPYLTKEIEQKAFHLVLHNGDFAYDLDSEEGVLGDQFMNKMQGITTRVPYMTAVGNHESAYNFSHYKYRFNMPGSTDNMYYSFNVGPVHFVVFSSDFYYFTNFGTEQLIHQYSWLEKDLSEANRPENRKKQPWIIAFSHRPMYCSNSDDNEHCPNINNIIRVGFPVYSYHDKNFVLGLEDLFYRQSVDVIFGAHEHSYERMWPVYQRTVCNGSTEDPYKDPPAPVHIVSGSAGCKENEDPFVVSPEAWSAFRSDDYGYTRITAFNATTLYMEQVSVEKEQLEVIDKFTITKSKLKQEFNCKQNVSESGNRWPYMTVKELIMDIFQGMTLRGTGR